MLQVSLDCHFLIAPSSCVPYVASFSGLFLFCFSSSCVPYVASSSGLFLFCFSSSCVPYVASFSGLFLFCFSSSCVPYVASVVVSNAYCVVWVFFLRLVYPMLPVSPDCPFLIPSSVFSNVYIQDDLYIYYILLIMNLNHVEPQGSIYLYKYNDAHYDV